MADSERQPSADTDEFKVPSKPKELIAWLERKRRAGKTPLPEYQMKLNLAFVLGHQWLVQDSQTKQLRPPKSRPSDHNAPVRITVNKIGGLVERIIAKLTKSAPAPEGRPVTDDDDDISAARVATRILGHELERLDWRAWLTEFLFWPATLGWSYGHIWWDPDQGDVVLDDGVEKLHTGEIALDIVPAYELSVDPSAKHIKDALWAVHTVIKSREAVYEQWGERVAPSSPVRSLVDEVLQMSNAEEANTVGDQVAVHRFWMLPSRQAPNGMVVTYTGQTILDGPYDFPYDHGKLPFVQENWLPPLGTLRGRTWVDDLIPMQADYNDARSREATIRRTLTPKLVAPTGSIDPQRVTSRIEVIPYNPTGQPPAWLVPDSGWLNQHEAIMSRSDQEMGSRAGVNEASAGQAGASTPAAAILALQEADDTKLAISATQLASFTEEIGDQLLALARQFWTEQRTVRVFSEEGGAIDVYKYRGADLSHRYDVHVSSESMLPKSKAARAQLVLELQARGIITSPQDVIRMLDMPGTDFIVRDMDLDTRRSHRELAQILEGGEQPEVQSYDNHAIHIDDFNRFRKSEEYEKLPDTVRARIDAHVAVHEEMVLAQAGVPLQSPQPYNPVASAANAAVRSKTANPGYLLDPMTGSVPDPAMIAAGQAPSPVTDKGIYNQAGIGQQAGQPGRVPGIPADNQAASMGQ